jgi:hypothetical protein
MRLAFVFAKSFVKSMDYHIKTELSLASLTATRPRIKLNQGWPFRRQTDIADRIGWMARFGDVIVLQGPSCAASEFGIAKVLQKGQCRAC